MVVRMGERAELKDTGTDSEKHENGGVCLLRRHFETAVCLQQIWGC